MRWRGAITFAVSLAILLAWPISADPVTEPITVARTTDISVNPSILASSNSPLAEGALAGLVDPAHLGVIAVDDASRMARLKVGAPSTYDPEEDLADAILDGVPVISGPGLVAHAGSVANIPLLDLEGSSPSQNGALQLTTVAAPEPSSLLLLGTCLLGLALVLFRWTRATELTVRK